MCSSEVPTRLNRSRLETDEATLQEQKHKKLQYVILVMQQCTVVMTDEIVLVPRL